MAGKLLDTYPVGATIYAIFDTFGASGESLTLTGLAVTDIEIFKNGSVTQRASDNGYALLDTDGIDFDTRTGIHGISIDLADNSDASFYAAGAQYTVVIDAVTINAQTVRFVLGAFRIVAAESTAGTPNVHVASLADDSITAAKIATGAIDADAIADNAIDAGAIAVGAIAADAFAAGAIDAAALAADAGTEIGTAVWATAARSLTVLDEDSTTLDLDATIRAAVGLAAANLDTQLTAIDDVVDAILVDTGATLDGKIDAILVDTGTTLDGKVDAIKAKTDSLSFTETGQVDANIQMVNDVPLTGDGQVGTEFTVAP